MTNQPNPADKHPDVRLDSAQEKIRPTSSEEERVWAVLEQARQNVKSIVKKEIEGEVLTGELLNLRLRTRR